jgi:hypothetical protein
MRASEQEPRTLKMLSAHKIKIFPLKKKDVLAPLHHNNDNNFLFIPCSRY